jgi:hypothetical protein
MTPNPHVRILQTDRPALQLGAVFQHTRQETAERMCIRSPDGHTAQLLNQTSVLLFPLKDSMSLAANATRCCASFGMAYDSVMQLAAGNPSFPIMAPSFWRHSLASFFVNARIGLSQMTKSMLGSFCHYIKGFSIMRSFIFIPCCKSSEQSVLHWALRAAATISES